MGEEEAAAWTAGENLGPPGAKLLHEQHEAVGAGVRALLSELFGALRDAGIALIEAHKQLAAQQTEEIAGAVERFGRSVDQTQSRLINRYSDRLAENVHAAARTMRERRWGEIAADLQEFAQRRPGLFVVSALGTGFAVGRLLMAAAERERERRRTAPPPNSVTAAVQSAPAPAEGVH